MYGRKPTLNEIWVSAWTWQVMVLHHVVSGFFFWWEILEFPVGIVSRASFSSPSLQPRLFHIVNIVLYRKVPINFLCHYLE